MTSRIAALAAHLLREGHVDNEPDARLAAIHILLASGASSVDSPPALTTTRPDSVLFRHHDGFAGTVRNAFPA